MDRIKSRKVGNGQYGTARFADKKEINSYYKRILYEPDNWRQGIDLPKIQGLIVGCQDIKRKTYALVDDGDVHTLLIGASGIGKTAFFLYPNLEYACAAGMSFITTDTKGVRPDRVR